MNLQCAKYFRESNFMSVVMLLPMVIYSTKGILLFHIRCSVRGGAAGFPFYALTGTISPMPPRLDHNDLRHADVASRV